MIQEVQNQIKKLPASIEEKTDSKTARSLRLDLMERCVKRIIEFSDSCADCRKYILKTERILTEVDRSPHSLSRPLLDEYRLHVRKIIAHLQKEHKLVKDGQYFELYVPLGIALGFPFGLLINNLALGFSIGLVIGSATGSAQDAGAKKKGLLI